MHIIETSTQTKECSVLHIAHFCLRRSLFDQSAVLNNASTVLEYRTFRTWLYCYL